MAVEMRKILRALYPGRSGGSDGDDPKRSRWVRARKCLLALLCVLALVKLSLFWYYYNTFISLEYDVEESKAQIDTQLQRRKNIILNLTIMVEDYARHERGLFKDIAEIRAAVMAPHREQGTKRGEPFDREQAQTADSRAAARSPDAPADGAAGAPAPSREPATSPRTGREGAPLPMPAAAAGTDPAADRLDAALSKILAIAEQYPTLKLNENFQKFMDALVDAENRIAEERLVYNKRANVMSTAVAKFPGYLFAKLYGFGAPAFFEPETEARTPPKVKY